MHWEVTLGHKQHWPPHAHEHCSYVDQTCSCCRLCVFPISPVQHNNIIHVSFLLETAFAHLRLPAVAMDWWPPPPPPPVLPLTSQTSSSAPTEEVAMIQGHKRDGKWRRTVIDQVRTSAIAAITGGLPRAFGLKKLLPHTYIPLMLLPNTTASGSAASSSSTMSVALDNELTFFGPHPDGSFTEALPRCYESSMAQTAAKRPYKRPRIFKKYPGKNKPPASKPEVAKK